MSGHEDFLRRHPEVAFLEVGACDVVADVLRRLGVLESGETVMSCERAGEGNMNLTLRARSDRRSVVVKQARPWVEKYPTIEAPWNRALVERDFYECVAAVPEVAAYMPRLLGCDAASRILVLEDLGQADDLTSLYAGDRLTVGEAQELAQFLVVLHESIQKSSIRESSIQESSIQESAVSDARSLSLANREMRALNAEHIFVVPFVEDNGVSLDELEPGLSQAAATLRSDVALRERVEVIRRRYLRDGNVLLHGDYFPGSWLRTGNGVRVIDPEFGFFGEPEFDVGVALGHLFMAGQDRMIVETFLREPRSETLDSSLIASYAAVEVIRRVLGVAQLPIAPSRGERAAWLVRARAALHRGRVEELMEGLPK